MECGQFGPQWVVATPLGLLLTGRETRLGKSKPSERGTSLALRMMAGVHQPLRPKLMNLFVGFI
jgi:hypothetical protein